MRALVTTVVEVVGAALVGVAVGFQFGLWPGLMVLGAAFVLFGALSA